MCSRCAHEQDTENAVPDRNDAEANGSASVPRARDARFAATLFAFSELVRCCRSLYSI